MPTISEALAIAVQQKQAGQVQAAEQTCRQVLAVDPRNADALHLLGVIALEIGRHAFAVECITRAIELDATQSAFFGNLGNALTAQGQLDKAIVCFSRAIELNPNDAVTNYNLGNVFQSQGELDEAVSCYSRAAEVKPDFAEAYSNLGHVFQAQGKLDEAVGCLRRALELRPDLAEAHNNLGNVYWVQGRLKQAFDCYRRAVELRPDLAEAQSNLGNAYQFQGKLDEAAACCRRAVELKPDYAVGHGNLGNALLTQGHLEEALDCYRRAVELKPNDAEARSNLGHALHQLGRFQEAFTTYERALELKADYAYAHFGRANLKLLMGDFEGGWPEYEWRFKTNERVHRKFYQPRWDGSPLEKRTILLHAEQGLGDTIQFVRYAGLVKKQNPAATVILESQRPLMTLLARCPSIDRLIARGDALPPFDVHVPLMCMPGILRTSLDSIPADIPYLFADVALVDQWRERLMPVRGLRIGVNWRGRPISCQRGIPLQCLSLLTELPGTRFVSLQKAAPREELIAATGKGEPIIDLGDDFDTTHGAFMDTAAVMMNLDLVISCDTSVPHLAGALGVPVWLVLPFVPDWRWLLDRVDSPWYPTMRLFRQKRPGDWGGVFEEIQSALRALVQSRSGATQAL